MKKNKNNTAILVTFIMAFIFSGNLFRINAFNNIKTVDLLQILACGGLIVAFIAVVMINLKKNTNLSMDNEQITNDVKKKSKAITHYAEETELELFLSCHDNSSTFLHFSSDGKMSNYEEFKKICTEYYSGVKGQKVTTIQQKIHVINKDIAVLGWTGNIIAQLKSGDIMKMNNYSVTSVFKMVDYDWKIIHMHESGLPPEIVKNIPPFNELKKILDK